MKFDMTDAPHATGDRPIKVGDVFPSKQTRTTAAWVVVAINGSQASVLGIDHRGNIVSAQNYGTHALENRPRIGYCADVAEMQLAIRWGIEQP